MDFLLSGKMKTVEQKVFIYSSWLALLSNIFFLYFFVFAPFSHNHKQGGCGEVKDGFSPVFRWSEVICMVVDGIGVCTLLAMDK